MRIYITKSFEKKYLSRYNFIDIEKTCESIKKISFINLKYPYLKFKLNISSVHFRWTLVKLENWNLILLTFCLKKDKNCWENIIRNTFSKEILNRQKLAWDDLEKWNYKIY